MKNTDKRNLLKWNTILWLAAMVLSAVFSFAFTHEVSMADDSAAVAAWPNAGFKQNAEPGDRGIYGSFGIKVI